MEVWKRCEITEIECGINSEGNLFLGNSVTGYNLPDTPENRQRVLADFERYTSGGLYHA